ncbi:MAG TPA: MBL fold metallo-hydrolase, partial [Thermoanaerobaculia bacterium]|nr:MBL fold metallo-hydrolase [Thermoanaerobaculia bacterium]
MTPKKSDHFDGERFFNPIGERPHPFSALPKLLREPRTPWPALVEVVPGRPPALDGAAAVATFIGHSTFLIQTPDGNVLTDPVYAQRVGPFDRLGPRRVRQPAVPFEDLPPISAVVVSHNHYDHCDVTTLGMLAKRFDPVVVMPLGNGALVREGGVRRVEELDWWDEAKTTPMPVTLTPARHSSARGPLDRDRALWGGFVLRCGGRRIFFAGDTAYAPFFGEIRRRIGPPDLALLPIGAYEP